jgi:hypothetical protein
MSKLQVTTKTVAKTVYIEEEQYQLTLTKEELMVIRMIVGNIVGGGPMRIITDSIYKGISECAPRVIWSGDYLKLPSEGDQKIMLKEASKVTIRVPD